MSWFPGTASSGGPKPRRKAAARSCWSRRPAVRQVAARDHSSGSTRSISAGRAPARAPGRRCAPKCRSETCRMRVATAEAGYTVSDMADEQSTEIFDDLYLGLRAGGAMRKQRRGEPLTAEERRRSGAGSGCRRGAKASRSAASPSARSGSASPSAVSSSAAGARRTGSAGLNQSWFPAHRDRPRRHHRAARRRDRQRRQLAPCSAVAASTARSTARAARRSSPSAGCSAGATTGDAKATTGGRCRRAT